MLKKDWFLVIFSALLMSLAYPPLPFGFVIYFTLVPLIFALEDKGLFDAFKMGYLFGLVSNSLLLFWIGWATVPGTVAAIVLLCLYTAFLSWFYALVQKKWGINCLFFLPFLWVAMEYVRSLTEISFPWLNLAYTQTYYLNLIQYASITGNYAVSFWIVCLNLIIYLTIKHKKRISLAISIFAILIILPYIYGWSIMSETIVGNNVKIALLQGNIEPKVKWDERFLDYNIHTFINMSKKAAEEDVDLILWPETAAPCYLASESVYMDRIQKTSDSLNIPLLVGTNDYEATKERRFLYYNSAFLFKPKEKYPQIYNKIHLVPFSEKIPYDEKLRISDKVQLGQSDFSSGRSLTIFQIPEGRFATLICFESVYPALVRDFVRQGTDFLVNITNDGWFGKTQGPFQHARIAVFRAIENRISIARCANTGVSMFIDPFGRVSFATEIFVRTIVIDQIPSKLKKTFYTRHGDWFAQGCFLVSFFLILASLIKRKE
ncbi:MAG: apolipoprotein N-acyltransferase [candidate division Zixibacteria bacterium]|nr:apolipoprotein N-acyltransferase [candidate division Zixibacteria bacterium]